MRTVLMLAAASLWAVLATPVASDPTCSAAAASYPPLPPPRPAPVHAVPIIIVLSQEAYVDVLLGDKKFRMLIDTGATCIYITPSVANALLAAGAATESLFKHPTRFADGSLAPRRRLVIKKVTVGDRVLSDVEAIVSATDQALMLVGFPVLNQMGRFTIDTQTKQLIFG
jgi:clan AA aspartic protease (TIGR02281 family)